MIALLLTLRIDFFEHSLYCIFLISTATTATFGVNKLMFCKLSGDSRGGSRVTKVAVKALFCPKIIHFLIKTGDFHSKIA